MDFFSNVYGNQKQKAYFSSLIREEKYAHAYILEAPAGAGKKTFAKALAVSLAAHSEQGTAEETEKIAAELVYMHAINGDTENAKQSSNYCKEFLQGESVQAKRALAAYCLAIGKTEEAEILIEQARIALKKERVKGVAKGEEILLSRLAMV